MLEMRPVCEHCGKSLPVNSEDAMICTFECTFCTQCVDQVLHNVCPNCGGGFSQRPIRPKECLKTYPPSLERKWRPVDMHLFSSMLHPVCKGIA
ncbi:MAG: DUF1272 domain-containing protein [Bacteroidetes bacterium]|nr:DUF1272 domain-containing protein [Bacteroidota bacterium]